MISIVIPVFNAAPYIEDCITSITHQSYQDFEIILVDDGSSDGSSIICDQLAANDNRIKTIHSINKGVSSARNIGIDNAIGQWIYFADADDMLLENGVATLMEHAGDEIGLVVAGYEIYNEQGNLLFAYDERRTETISTLDALKTMYRPAPYPYQGYIWSKLFKTEIIKDNSIYFNEQIKFNEDRLFIVEYLCAAKCKTIYTTQPIYKYIQRASGAMASLEHGFNQNFITDLDAYILMLENIKRQYNDSELIRLAKEGVEFSYENIKEMQSRYDVVDTSLDRRLNRKVKKSLGNKYFLIKRYKKFKRKLKRMLKLI